MDCICCRYALASILYLQYSIQGSSIALGTACQHTAADKSARLVSALSMPWLRSDTIGWLTAATRAIFTAAFVTQRVPGGSGMDATRVTTVEMGLIGPVAFITVTTCCTPSARVARVNKHHTHATMAQGRISRGVNGEFTTDSSYGERCTHKGSLQQIEHLCKCSHLYCVIPTRGAPRFRFVSLSNGYCR